MASAFNLADFNLNEGEKFDVSQIVFEAFKTKPSIQQVHDVITGIKSGDLIPFMGLLEDVGGCIEGCDIDATTSAIPMTNKRWAPVPVGARLAHCERDAEKIFNGLRGRMTKEGKWDAEGSEHMQLVAQRAEDALTEIILRYGWFGDTDAENIADGGTVTYGKDPALFNCVDGIWKQIFDLLTVYSSNYVAIAKNDEATYSAQLALASTDGRTTLRSMYEAADTRLLASPDKVYLVTRTLFNNWMAEIEGSQVTNGTYGSVTLNGVTYTTYRNIPIIVVDYWDRMIQAYFNSGTAYHLPHRALLTTAANIPLGFVEDNPFEVYSFYDKKDKQVYIDIEVDVDAKVLEDYMLVAAY